MIKISQAQYDDAVNRLLGREKVADAMTRAIARDRTGATAFNIASRLGSSPEMVRRAVDGPAVRTLRKQVAGLSHADPLALRAAQPGSLVNQGGPSPTGGFARQAAPNLPGGMARRTGFDTSHLYSHLQPPPAPAASSGLLARLFNRKAA